MTIPTPSPSEEVRARVAAVPLIPPIEVEAHLLALGYRGQERARRFAAVLVYRHVRRLRRIWLNGVNPTSLGPRQNVLLVGPTGTGKTYLVELLFREVLGVPTVIVDATRLSETGYVGDDVSTILSRLVDAAEGDEEWAGCGVVCVDEFDKLAASRSTTRFGGAETTKDLRLGVQRGLLTMLSSQVGEYSPDHGYSGKTAKRQVRLSGTTFVACGAFSGLASQLGGGTPVGFGCRSQVVPTSGDEPDPSALAAYGLLPELVGRFSQVVPFSPLSRDDLSGILASTVRSYQEEFAEEGLALRVDPGAADQVVSESMRRGHGARGLHAVLAAPCEEAAFCHFGLRRRGSVVLRVSQGRLVAESHEAGQRKRSMG